MPRSVAPGKFGLLLVAAFVAASGCGAGPCEPGTGGGAQACAPKAGGGAGGPVTVTGTVSYDFVPSVYLPATGLAELRFGSASQRPVRGGVIQVVAGGTTLATTTTGDDGHFTVSFTPAAGGLTLFAQARTLEPAIQVQDNTSGGAVWALSVPLSGASQSLALRATHGWTGTGYDASTRRAAPFAILDSMLTATRAFTAVRPGLTFPTLACNWSPLNAPSAAYDAASGQIITSHYQSGRRQLYILGKDGSDTDEFDAHVIVHEWGHFFEDTLSRSDSIGGGHGVGDVLDPRVAFSEGWGDALGAMVLPETGYADTYWTPSGHLTGFGFDAETEPLDRAGGVADDPTPSSFSETSVMRLIYDLFDASGGGEPFDGVALGLGPILDVLTGAQRTTPALATVASFVTGLKAAGAPAAALDTLAAHYRIGAITTAWGDGDAQLRGMYTAITLPFASSGLTLTSANADTANPVGNTAGQNRYFAFTGSGARVTVRSVCAQGLELQAYRQGVELASATRPGGNHTISFDTISGATYVVVLGGWGATGGSYPVSVQVQ